MGKKTSYTDLENRIRELENLLREKDQEVDRLKNIFLSHITHEIRTPMNSIIGFSNLLADDSLTTDQRDLYLEYIHNSSEHLLSLIENMIDMSMLESGQVELHDQSCCLSELFDELYFTFNKKKHRMGRHTIALLLNRDADSIDFSILMDRLRLSQVMSNLIENAIKYTEKGVIEFGYLLKNNYTLQFFVRDTGRGIDLNHQHLLFDSFRRLESGSSSDLAGGAGLGLAIARGLVSLMGGEIWVEPNVRSGSVFKFNLPLRLPDREVASEYEEKNARRHLGITRRNIAL